MCLVFGPKRGVIRGDGQFYTGEREGEGGDVPLTYMYLHAGWPVLQTLMVFTNDVCKVDTDSD